MKILFSLALLLMATIAPVFAQNAVPDGDPRSYSERIAAWRKNREEILKKEGGWLSVAGLHWLKEGENAIGAGASNDLFCPPAPRRNRWESSPFAAARSR